MGSQKALVNVEIDEYVKFPLIIRSLDGKGIKDWASENRNYLEKELLKKGAILFRGFNIDSTEKFNEFINSLNVELMTYVEQSSPRTRIESKVYTSTEYPPDKKIAMHNEMSYSKNYPGKIWFCCTQPALKGGETPIVDVREVYKNIPTPIINKFEEKGWMIVRNYGEGFGIPVEKAFNTNNRDEITEYCNNNSIEHEWIDGNKLKTKQTYPAIIKHRQTTENLWFNHAAFWHISNLDPDTKELLLEEFGEEALPYNTYYGDGSKIDEMTIETINKAYKKSTVLFKWEKGDVLFLDNELIAHGRSTFEGKRKVLVAMGEPITR